MVTKVSLPYIKKMLGPLVLIYLFILIERV